MIRNGIRALAFTAGLFSASLACNAFAQETYDLSLSIFTPPANAANVNFEAWAAELKEKSNGRLNVQLFPSGQMGPPTRQYDLARTGTADMAWFIHGFTPGRFPITEAAYLPGLFRSSETGSKALMEAAPEFLQKEHRGVKILALAYSTPLTTFTRSSPISSLEDLDGKRLRHPGAPIADTIKALGAAPVAVPPPEMGEALSRGIVDGIVTNYEAADALGILDDLKHDTYIDTGSVTFALVMNQGTYEGLPADLRAIIDETSGVKLSTQLGRTFDQAEADAKAKATGIAQVELASAEQAEFDAALQAEVDRRLEAGSEARAFYDQLQQAATAR